jgi:hypothetical protein
MADIHTSLPSQAHKGERTSKRTIVHFLKQAELHAEDGRTMLDVARYALAGCAAYMAMLAAARAQLAAAGEPSGGDFNAVLERITLLMGDSYGLARDLARTHRVIERIDDGDMEEVCDAHVRPLVAAAERFVEVVKSRALPRGEH